MHKNPNVLVVKASELTAQWGDVVHAVAIDGKVVALVDEVVDFYTYADHKKDHPRPLVRKREFVDENVSHYGLSGVFLPKGFMKDYAVRYSDNQGRLDGVARLDVLNAAHHEKLHGEVGPAQFMRFYDQNLRKSFVFAGREMIYRINVNERGSAAFPAEPKNPTNLDDLRL